MAANLKMIKDNKLCQHFASCFKYKQNMFVSNKTM